MAKTFKSHTPKPIKPPGSPVAVKPAPPRAPAKVTKDSKPKEIGGPSGPEPTRYGDWERKGLCVDF